MNDKEYVVDRIEGNYVILEDNEGKIFNAEKKYINGIAKEGDILYKKDNLYYIDNEASKQRKEEIDQLMKGLWEE
ncbi:DUF3006 domain-containing protein [Clostridium sp. AL.422]|uniref:DUF3006 domain-containing protein n=1 Tax=Clostridium TaxID=1485 RepID=UPI00293DBC84|nr:MULTISPECIES: DUF3006 domain-containing protein [unclassified Clostridium]MDV4151489.1 DUF3006 domain-containing protein [Clostridium sp. AL.422]